MKTHLNFLSTGLVLILLLSNGLNSFGQLVTNTNTAMTYPTIQSAIDDPMTVDGHTLTVSPGTYAENVLVNKELTILGPKAGIDGSDPSRGTDEAVVYPAVIYFSDGVNWASGGKVFNITADNVTIDGFTIDGDNPALESGYEVNGASPDCESGIASHGGYAGEDPDEAGDNLFIRNNVFRNLMGYGIIMWSAASMESVQSAEITHNKFQNIFYGAGVWLGQNYYAKVENNTFSDLRYGILIYWYWLSPANDRNTIKNNTIMCSAMARNDGTVFEDASGINVALVYNNVVNAWNIENNAMTNASTRSAGSHGMDFNINWTPVAISVKDNTISGFEAGYSLRSCGDGGENTTIPPTQAMVITGGSVSGCGYGALVTNLSYYYGTAQSAMYELNNIDFHGNTVAGIFVEDASPLNNNPSTVAMHAGNCFINGNAAGILVSGDYAYATANDNDLSANGGPAINNLSPNNVGATCNWFGNWTGPANAGNPGGTGDIVTGIVDFEPWLVDGTDDDGSLAGFQPVPGSCTEIKCGSNDNKYLICHNGKLLCIDYFGALDHLAHGDHPGACDSFKSSSAVDDLDPAGDPGYFQVSLAPNPGKTDFCLQVISPADEKADVRIMDPSGRVLDRATVENNESFRFGQDYRPGLYIIEIRQGDHMKNLKVIKE